MGNLFTNLTKAFNKLSSSKKASSIIMLGLDAAGKTTILYKLRLNEQIQTIPTIGFNVEQVSYKNIEFSVWDIGGQDKLRALWRHYFSNCDALIFVVDCADHARVGQAKAELHKLLQEPQLLTCVCLVFANKQDLPGAMTTQQCVDQLDLRGIKRKWFAQSCCAHSGEGLFEGLDWLANALTS